MLKGFTSSSSVRMEIFWIWREKNGAIKVKAGCDWRFTISYHDVFRQLPCIPLKRNLRSTLCFRNFKTTKGWIYEKSRKNNLKLGRWKRYRYPYSYWRESGYPKKLASLCMVPTGTYLPMGPTGPTLGLPKIQKKFFFFSTAKKSCSQLHECSFDPHIMY